MRRSPARSALGLCLSLACLALVWHALTLAGWLTSRVTAAQGYLRDVRDLTDLAERPGIREAVRSVVASGALARLERDVVGRLHVVDDETMSVGVDVSHSGEATWVYRRYQQALRSSSPGKRDGNKSARSDPGFAPLVVDVGANFGWYTLLSLALGCHVVAFEPIPTYANILALGLRRNPGFTARTTLHRAVVAEEAGRNFTVKVPIANPLSGWLKHLGMTSMVGEHGLIKGFPDNWMHFNVSSPSVRVDDVVPPDVPVCMLKADVEGYEPAVLRTAERLLSSGRVHAVQLEVTTSPDRRVASETVEALAHLETLGFTVRQLPRRMDNNASATFALLPAFPSARAVPGCKKSRSPLAGTPLAETPFGRAYHCDINTFSTNLVARHRQHHGRNASS